MGTGVNGVSHVRRNYKSDDDDESRIGVILTTRNDRIVFFLLLLLTISGISLLTLHHHKIDSLMLAMTCALLPFQRPIPETRLVHFSLLGFRRPIGLARYGS